VQDYRQRQAHRGLHQRMQHSLAFLGLLQGHTFAQQGVVRQANLSEGDYTLPVLLHLSDDGFEFLPGSIESFWVQSQRRPDLPWFLCLQR
jgi:hypothetical protein